MVYRFPPNIALGSLMFMWRVMPMPPVIWLRSWRQLHGEPAQRRTKPSKYEGEGSIFGCGAAPRRRLAEAMQ